MASWMGLLLAGLFVLTSASCAGKPRAAAGPAPLDEPALMVALRSSARGEPTKALALADEAEQRFGDSSFAEERGALAIRALINLQRIGAARSRAHAFLARYPRGPYAAEVEAWTGVHVTPGAPQRKRE